METKNCNKCKNELIISSFTVERRNMDGLSNYCRSCRKELRINSKTETFKNEPKLLANTVLLSSIKGYEDYKGYAISNNGKVLTCRKRQFGYYGYWKELKLSLNNTNRYEVCLCYNGGCKFYLVHRLVAICFIVNPHDKPWINHKDSNPLNNNSYNLEWCTPKENSQHAVTYGFLPKGSQVKTSILNEGNVHEIKRLRKMGKRFKEIAKIFSVSIGTIEAIIYGKSWKHIK